MADTFGFQEITPYTTNKGIVVDGILDSRSKAQEAVDNVSVTLSALTNELVALTTLPQIEVTLGAVTATVDDYVPPIKPIRGAIDTAFPAQSELIDVTPNYGVEPSLAASNADFDIPVPVTDKPIPAFPLSPVLQATDPNFETKPTITQPVANFPAQPVQQSTNYSPPAEPELLASGADFDIPVPDTEKPVAAFPLSPDLQVTDASFETKPILGQPVASFPAQPAQQSATANFPQEIDLDPVTANYPAAPDTPDLASNFPVADQIIDPNPSFASPPADVVIGVVDNLVIDPVPLLLAAEPVIREITPPAPFSKAAPVGRTLPERVYPNVPNKDMPAVPVLRTLTLPPEPVLLDIQFEGILPLPLDTPPDVDFKFTDAEYQSVLTDALRDKLIDWILNVNQTGLSEGVQQRIWDQGRERTGSQAKRLIAQARRRFAALGWNVAPGDEMLQMKEAVNQAVVLDVAENRAITVTRANLEQANVHFAFTSSIALEHELMALHDSMQGRALDAAKFAVTAVIDLFQLKVSYHNAGVTLYATQASVYRDRTQAELAKLEKTRILLEFQKLIGTLNEQDIAMYTKQIDAVVAIFGLYSTELQAVKTQLEGDALTLQQVESEIKIWLGELQGKGQEYQQYTAELGGEETKAKIFGILGDVFGRKVDAWKSQHDVKGLKVEKDIQVNIDTPLKLAELKNQVFKIQNDAESSRVQSVNSINEVATRIFSAKNEAESSRLKAETDLQNVRASIFGIVSDQESKRMSSVNDNNRTKATVFGVLTTAETERLRSIDATNKTAFDIYGTAIDAEFKRVTTDLEYNKSLSEIYKIGIEAESTRLRSISDFNQNQTQTFSALVQAEAERLKSIGDSNSQEIEAFKATISAQSEKAKATNDFNSLLIELFKTLSSSEVERVKTVIQTNQVDSEIYRNAIDAESTRIQSDNEYNKSLSDIYKIGIDAEVARIGSITDYDQALTQNFVALVGAESSRLQALGDSNALDVEVFKATISAEAEKSRAVQGENELLVRLFEAVGGQESSRLDTLSKINANITEIRKTDVGAKSSEIDALVNLAKVDADIYGTEVGAEGTRINAQVSVLDSQLKRVLAEADLNVETLKANLSAMLSKVELILGALKTEAQVRTQLAAGALASVSYNAGVNSGESTGQSTSISSSSSVSDTTVRSG
jgi:hypothetical protein